MCICVRESLLMRVCSGKSTFVTFKCTKALPRHHYAFNLTVQQSACSSVVMLPVQLSTSTSLLTALTLCRHILVSLLFFQLFNKINLPKARCMLHPVFAPGSWCTTDLTWEEESSCGAHEWMFSHSAEWRSAVWLAGKARPVVCIISSGSSH